MSFTLGDFIQGMHGLAVLRHWTDDPAEAQRWSQRAAALNQHYDQAVLDIVIHPTEEDYVTGYETWAGSYDGPNPMIAIEQPEVEAILDTLPAGRSLDVGTGTGRFAQLALVRGWEVAGIDGSAHMPNVAKTKLPNADLRQGDMTNLPWADDTFDLVTSGLAICHLEDPEPAITEAARVLRSGGTFVFTNPHPTSSIPGGQAFHDTVLGGAFPFVRNHHVSIGAYIVHFRSSGFAIDALHEPSLDAKTFPLAALDLPLAEAAMGGLPNVVVWHLTLS
ncbi:MAG: SAM-dependent methyltransferase [Candidatus Poriferisodalaceae bacterium]|jgi:SAM-dependent methyltransferase